MLCSGNLKGTGEEPIFRGKMIPFEIAELEVIIGYIFISVR